MESTKDLNYYKKNCEEDYINTPISVLRYITELEQALQLQQTGFSGSYKWNNASEFKPTTYITGEFDGKDSDNVLVKCKDGSFAVAKYNNGYLDDKFFEAWYDSNTTYEIYDVLCWTNIYE